MNSELPMKTGIPSIETQQQLLSEQSKPSLTPTDLINSGNPYITYADQYISTEFWPNKKCKCQGRGTYGMLAPKGQAENQIKLGDNEACLCKSGKKYKKCCRDRVDRLAKGGYRILICPCVGKAEMAQNEFVETMREELKTAWKIEDPSPTEV